MISLETQDLLKQLTSLQRDMEHAASDDQHEQLYNQWQKLAGNIETRSAIQDLVQSLVDAGLVTAQQDHQIGFPGRTYVKSQHDGTVLVGWNYDGDE